MKCPTCGNALASDTLADQWFDAFWQAFWRKRDRGHARKLFLRVCKTEAQRDVILAAVKAQTPEMLSRDVSKRPYPGTWLAGQGWMDAVEQYEPEKTRLDRIMEGL